MDDCIDSDEEIKDEIAPLEILVKKPEVKPSTWWVAISYKSFYSFTEFKQAFRLDKV